jgi:hypothetical protein
MIKFVAEKVCWLKGDFWGNMEIWSTFKLVLWKLRNTFLYGSFSIRDISKIRFLEDKWLGAATL